MTEPATPKLYLAKALEAEEASKRAADGELRDAWLEIAGCYRLLAAGAQRATLAPMTDI